MTTRPHIPSTRKVITFIMLTWQGLHFREAGAAALLRITEGQRLRAEWPQSRHIAAAAAAQDAAAIGSAVDAAEDVAGTSGVSSTESSHDDGRSGCRSLPHDDARRRVTSSAFDTVVSKRLIPIRSPPPALTTVLAVAEKHQLRSKTRSHTRAARARSATFIRRGGQGRGRKGFAASIGGTGGIAAVILHRA